MNLLRARIALSHARVRAFVTLSSVLPQLVAGVHGTSRALASDHMSRLRLRQSARASTMNSENYNP
jgi:hypothetical protein